MIVIAEIGSNHEGSLEQATEMIRRSRAAGATHVKFQFWSEAAYLWSDSALRLRGRLAGIPKEWLPSLREAAQREGLNFGVSVFLPGDVPLVADYVHFLKVAHWRSSDDMLLDAVAETDLPYFVSYAEMPAWEREDNGLRGIPLFCVPEYPAPTRGFGIDRLQRFRDLCARHGVLSFGLSDHTRSLLSGAIAVAYGAEVLEKHVRLAETHHTPDAPVSLTFEEFKRYVTLALEANDLCTS